MSTKFKIYAKDILAAKPNYDILEKNVRYDNIIQNTLEYAYKYLDNFDFPSVPNILVGNIRGFEELKKDANATNCRIQVIADFKTSSGVIVIFEIPINIHYGEYIKPSVCIYKNKKYVLSQSLIDSIIKNTDTVYPKSTQIYDKERITTHLDTQKDSMFNGPTQQYDLKEYI